MASPVIGRYNTESLVTKFLHNAHTSKYLVYFKPPAAVIRHIASTKGVFWNTLTERVNISCISAKLPGSSFATHDVTGDFRGVTEKMAYRRMYDDTFSVTMLVDHEYKTLHFFEGWMDYIAGKQTGGQTNNNYKNFRTGSRMSYPNGPNGYRTNAIDLIKFDRDLDNSIRYSFIEGFPISMDAMEISYGESDILRLNVNFNFVRYVTEPYAGNGGSGAGPRVSDRLSANPPPEPQQLGSATSPESPVALTDNSGSKNLETFYALNFLNESKVLRLDSQNIA
tara:strand:- start:2233 stop:3075 length:843 start_codon:yes stop_codon:yes gene_type:complete